VNLSKADLTEEDLCEANLSAADLEKADLSGARMMNALLRRANLSRTRLQCADLSRAHLNRANMYRANLSRTDLTSADISSANLRRANLSQANLSKADLRNINLQNSKLDNSMANDVMLWETQRAGWSIRGIACERAFWDEEAREHTAYAPGEFERLYSNQTCIELFYQGGVSTFELNTLPALLHHLASLHSSTNIRLKSIEETGGGAKISISVGDAAPQTTEKIKADAMRVYRAQLALRNKETARLQIERDYIERLLIGKLIPAMLCAGTPQNIFNAPVTGVVIASGESTVKLHQTINDNSALIAVLEKIMDCRADLGLANADANELETELEATKTELKKPNPDKSIVSNGIRVIRTLVGEALKGAATKLGENAASVDWPNWLHQLSQFAHHIQ